MHKSATKCNETIGKWCKNKHGASKIIDTFETYHGARVDSGISPAGIYVFRPEFTPSGRHIAVLAFFGRNKSVLGRFRPFLASSGRSWAPARPMLRCAWCGPFSLPRPARPAPGGPWSAQRCSAPTASSNPRLGRPSSSRSGAPLRS
jgi:hypothetical protein